MATQEFRPFNRAAAPFAIGLAPLGVTTWLHVDGERDRYIDEKRALYSSQFNAVFMAEPDTMDAQREVMDMIAKTARMETQKQELPKELVQAHPLAAAALLVQDDLILMRRDNDHWRLVAASLCFPSSWSLAEKFGKPLEEVHAPVPGMAGKMADRINRIFNMLRVEQPLWRENWSLDSDGELRHERSMNERTPNYRLRDLQKPMWLRTEYQTLSKLPVSGDILFTIKILSKPLAEIAKLPNGPVVHKNLLEQLTGLNEAQRKYKGIQEGTDKLFAWLAANSVKA